ncbi:MAG TPA: extracellular solute-binding protein [Gemmatimonadaceae bacterium]|nr:extracellular solute-binding protein [Gemmatimonadaceae bacterium]
MPLFAADTLLLFVAASLTQPLKPVLDAFSARTGIVVERESGATLEHVRKITELHRTPDVFLSADVDVLPRLLVPKYASWYAEFARNRMVVAYTPKSKHAAEITAGNWTSILRAPDVEVGRTNPDIAPVGYRTLLMLQLAERYYRSPGLARALVDNAPPRNMRPNAAELAALLAAGELDYIYDYESVAESNGFRFIALPDAIDLSNPARAAEYATATVDVGGDAPGTRLRLEGEPILYGLTVPIGAPHPSAARRFLDYLTSAPVIAQLRAAHVDMLDHPIVVGRGAPAELHGVPGR